jgi:outer membrane protein TolC
MNKIALFLVLSFIYIESSMGQTSRFTLNDVIRIAQEQSPDAILSKHRFRASYWQFRSFKASYLPGLSFSGTIPDLNRSIDQITNDLGEEIFVERKSISNLARLSLSQNIGLTGGSVFINSNLQQISQIDVDGSTRYLSTPVRIGFQQPIFAFNRLRWDKKIEPLRYDEAKKTYIEAVEQVSLRAIARFFDLANAQLNLDIAKINFSNSDTLYKIAQGRYNIGTIAENDLLQMQLSRLNSETELNRAEIDLELQKTRLRSFLGYNERMNFDLVIPDSIPAMELNFQNIMELAQKNNPDIIARQRLLLEARRDVAQAKGQRGRNINLYASYGLTHTAEKEVQTVYQTPFQNEQQLQIGFQIPIIDWGQGRGRVKMAESQQELVEVQISQDQVDFEQNVFLQVMQFNLQDDQVNIAATAERIAQSRYDVTKQRFLIGKIDVLNLNDALKEKDSSKRAYIQSLRNYWSYFYTLRQLTLYDFINNRGLDQDFDIIVK